MAVIEFETLQDEIIAEGIDFDTYLHDYADQLTELVDGKVIRMSPVRDVHNLMVRFLVTLFDAYLVTTKEGELRHEGFVMKIVYEGKTRSRQPDLFVVTTANLDKLHPTYMDGAADLVVEVLSPESLNRDRGEKFVEYEAAGVREYWLVDPQRGDAAFYVLEEDGLFRLHYPDQAGLYHSRALPRLKLPVSLLSEHPIPNTITAVKLVEKMLADG